MEKLFHKPEAGSNEQHYNDYLPAKVGSSPGRYLFVSLFSQRKFSFLKKLFNIDQLICADTHSTITSMAHPDQKYIEALVNGDQALIKELYKKCAHRILALVKQNNGTETDAADVFQEGLLSIYRRARTGDFILTCPIEAFVYLVCKNKWINELNKRTSTKTSYRDPDEYDIGEETFALEEESRVHDERRKLIYEKLDQLGSGCKELLQLSWEDRSMEEIATMLNISYAYARKRKTICMQKLVEMVRESASYHSLKW